MRRCRVLLHHHCHDCQHHCHCHCIRHCNWHNHCVSVIGHSNIRVDSRPKQSFRYQSPDSLCFLWFNQCHNTYQPCFNPMHTAHNCTVHKSLHYPYIASNGRLVPALPWSSSSLHGLCHTLPHIAYGVSTHCQIATHCVSNAIHCAHLCSITPIPMCSHANLQTRWK